MSRERWRVYRGEKLAANTLGFVGYSGDTFSGRYGLERYYDDTLKEMTESLMLISLLKSFQI